MGENHKEELQLLPALHNTPTSSSHIPRWPVTEFGQRSISNKLHQDAPPPPSLDLQLSISVQPISNDSAGAEALKWHAAEQIRIAALEKAYAERVRELTRREMELAQSEFVRARHMWERAREEVDKAEKLKQLAIMRRIDDPTCFEVTCHACRQIFRP